MRKRSCGQTLLDASRPQTARSNFHCTRRLQQKLRRKRRAPARKIPRKLKIRRPEVATTSPEVVPISGWRSHLASQPRIGGSLFSSRPKVQPASEIGVRMQAGPGPTTPRGTGRGLFPSTFSQRLFALFSSFNCCGSVFLSESRCRCGGALIRWIAPLSSISIATLGLNADDAGKALSSRGSMLSDHYFSPGADS